MKPFYISCLLFLICLEQFASCNDNPEETDKHETLKYQELIHRTIRDLKAGGEPAERIITQAKRVLHSIAKRDDSISVQCYEDLIEYVDKMSEPVASGEKFNWAHQMMDSFGSIFSGIVQGNLYWLGDFYECLNVKVMRNDSNQLRFQGQYCLAFINVVVTLPMKLGSCFPSSCTGQELQDISSSFVPLPFTIIVPPEYCQTSDSPKWDTTTMIIWCVYGFFIALVTAATIYDFICGLRQSKLPTKAVNMLHLEPGIVCVKGSDSCSASLLLAFSAIRNVKKIMDVNNLCQDSLGVIHGLRAVSISWVVVGHTFLVLNSFLPWKNMLVILDAIKLYSTQALTATEFAVDTFFCLSGFLAAYVMLENLSKGVKFNYPLYVIHRLFRLSPSYWLFLAFMSGPYAYFGKGPTFGATAGDLEVCREKWWQNALYINIYFDETTKCLPQAWYVCMDVVYYIILYPIIVIPLHLKPTLGLINYALFFIASILTPALLVYFNDLAAYPSANVTDEQRDNFMTMVYDKPWGRMTAVLIGIAYGTLLQKKGRNVKLNLLFVYFGWICSAMIGLSLVYGMRPYLNEGKPMYLTMQVIFGCLTRPAWALMVGWVIYACSTGYGGVINSILAWKGFVPLSRLSYAIYIVHFTVIGLYYAARADGTYIDVGIMAYITIAMVILSIVAGLVLNILAEAPFFALEKIIFKSCIPKRDSNVKHSPEYESLLNAKQDFLKGLKTSEYSVKSCKQCEQLLEKSE